MNTQKNKTQIGFSFNPRIKRTVLFSYFVALNSTMACAGSGVKNHIKKETENLESNREKSWRKNHQRSDSHWTEDSLETHLLIRDLLLESHIVLFCLPRLVFITMASTKPCTRSIATSSVWSDILAKQTLNQPGSSEWQDEPGEMFRPTSHTIFVHKECSASNVLDFKRCRKSTQQNKPPLLFKQPIPAFFKPETNLSLLSLSLFLFTSKYLVVNLSSDSKLASRCWVWEEISPKLDILVAADTTFSLFE